MINEFQTEQLEWLGELALEASRAAKPRRVGTDCGRSGQPAALVSQPGRPGGRCIGPTPPVCPTVKGVVYVEAVDNIPFEYVHEAGRDRSTNMVVVTRRSRPRTQGFIPVVQTAVSQFIANMTRFGMPIEAMLTSGAFCCRCMTGTNRLSNHSHADAFDLAGVRWANSGGRETIVHNWNTAERALLRRINACLRLSFATVIDYHRADHRDHFHCDMNRGRASSARDRDLRRPETWRFTQEALNFVLGSSVPITGKFDSATKRALSEFGGVSADVLRNTARVNEILDRLFTQIASGTAENTNRAAAQSGSQEFEAPRSFPARPKAPAPSPALPVSLFRPTPPDPLVPSAKMETALKNAIRAIETARRLPADSYPVRFTIVDITDPSGSFPSAGYLEDVTDFIASEIKVAVMYAAYALRDMVNRFAGATRFHRGYLFFQLKKQMDTAIANASRNVQRSLVMPNHRVPSYDKVFAVKPAGPRGLQAEVTFTPAYNQALEKMIVPSSNGHTGICVRGIGYGYLNGSFSAGGFFDESNNQGLWMAGDYSGGKIWPSIRIVSRNDGLVAQTGSTRTMAKLVTLIMTNRILDSSSCNEMRGRLLRAAKGPDTPWIARTGIFKAGTITHNKLGLAPLKTGRNVRSEVSVYQSPVAAGRRYVVAWHNATGGGAQFPDIARIIKAAITEYERP